MGNRILILLLLCWLAGGTQAAAYSSIDTVLASEGVVTTRAVWRSQLTAGQLGLQQDSSGIDVTAAAARIGTNRWRLGVGNIRWIHVLDAVSIPGLSDLRRVPRRAGMLPDVDPGAGQELEEHIFAAGQVSAGGLVFGAAARLALQQLAADRLPAAEEQQLQLRLLSDDGRFGTAASLLVRETVLPSLEERPYRLEYPAPGPGLGREWRSIVWGRWLGGISVAGLFISQLPYVHPQPGGFVYHRRRGAVVDLDVRAAYMPDRLALRRQQFSASEAGLLAAVVYDHAAVRWRLLAEAVSREGASRLSAAGSTAIGESGVRLMTTSEVKASGRLRLETGMRWEYRRSPAADGPGPELLRASVHAGFVSPAQRRSQKLRVTLGHGPIRAEYSAAQNTDVPGVEQQAVLSLRREGYSLHAKLAWNSLIRGASGEAGVRARQ